MSRKTCLITGANSGIGKAAAIRIAREGCRVVIGCRNQERGSRALEEIRQDSGSTDVELLLIDMSEQASVRRAVEEYEKRYGNLDILIHNAADFDISRKEPVFSKENIESVWATNHIGPVLLTDLLLDTLRASRQGRIITVASQGLMLHPFLTVDTSDPEFRERKFSVAKAYYQSKLAQVMYTYWLADEVRPEYITVNCLQVTNVKIDITRYPYLSKLMRFMYSIKSCFSISPEEMARIYTSLALSPDFERVTGKYVDEKGNSVTSSPYSRKRENIEAVMDVTYKYIKYNHG